MLQRDLVRHSAVKQPAMVALLDRLETAGMIERTKTTSDKRAATVELTDRGHNAAAFGRTVLLEVNEEAVSGFTPTEATLLVDLLGRLIANLDASSGK